MPLLGSTRRGKMLVGVGSIVRRHAWARADQRRQHPVTIAPRLVQQPVALGSETLKLFDPSSPSIFSKP